jgi:Coenzyme PQQ synthesis protein D (PqqD)
MIAETMTPVDKLIQIADGLEATNLDGETVLLDVNSGHYFGLNEVGSRIIELVGEPTSIETVIETMAGEYDVDKDRLATDVESFIGQMIERNLIREVDGASK